MAYTTKDDLKPKLKEVYWPPKNAGYMMINGKRVYTGRNWGKMYIPTLKRNRGGKVSKEYSVCGATVITGR